MALGKKIIPKNLDVHFATANFLLPGGQQQQEQRKTTQGSGDAAGLGKKFHFDLILDLDSFAIMHFDN